MNNNKDVFLRF